MDSYFLYLFMNLVETKVDRSGFLGPCRLQSSVLAPQGRSPSKSADVCKTRQ